MRGGPPQSYQCSALTIMSPTTHHAPLPPHALPLPGAVVAGVPSQFNAIAAYVAVANKALSQAHHLGLRLGRGSRPRKPPHLQAAAEAAAAAEATAAARPMVRVAGRCCCRCACCCCRRCS